MPIRYLKKYAALEGTVAAEDAETLAHWLGAQAQPTVHLGKCTQVHSAVLQVLLALRPRIAAPPPEPRLAAVLAAVPA